MTPLTQHKIAEYVPQLMQKMEQRGASEQRGVGNYFAEHVLAYFVAQLTGTEAPDPSSYAKYRKWRNQYYTPLVSRTMLLLGYDVHSQRLENIDGHPAIRPNPLAYTTNLAKGFTCHITHSVFDHDHRPIFLRMIGPQWSVEGNWSALVSGRKPNFIQGRKVLYEGGQYQHKKTILPCGWMESVTWHNNGDVRFAENGAGSVYVLSDKPLDGQPPAAFGDLLQKTLAIPTKQAWMPHLWCEAHLLNRPLIYPLEKCNAMYGWSIRLDAKKWQALIEESLKKQILTI